jgi:hypothetical protein
MTFLNVWMWIIREMEHAIDMCERDCTDSNFKTCLESPAVHVWDIAVAYYTGSRMTTDVDAGTMMFHAAEKRCLAFKTCGENGDQTSGAAQVNQLVFKHFMVGQRQLLRGDCNGASKSKELIIQQMAVPLVQGTIQYAHKVSHSDSYDEQFSADAAAFAFSVLPIVDECSQEDAIAIHRELKAGKDSDVDFQAVKNAFERNYRCMNITCEEVGGIYDPVVGDYEPDAKPCTTSSSYSESSPPKNAKGNAKMVSISLGTITIFSFVVLIFGKLLKQRGAKVVKEAEYGNPEKVQASGELFVDEDRVESLTFM